MKILLVNPRGEDSFWNFRRVLNIVSRKSIVPPLGLLTVAAMLPPDWEKKLVDTNVTDLADDDIQWADYVFLGAMQAQKDSARKIIRRCNDLKKKIVAGGPLFTTNYQDYDGIDHFVLGEAEATLPPFLKDLENGQAKPIYVSPEKPDLATTPIPLWSLINMDNYLTMNAQYSRGCPFDCEFCDIIALFGKHPRMKTAAQMVAELEALYQHGWRGQVFIADDNFISNKKIIKAEVLPAMIEWAKKRGYPFNYLTELTITVADDEELMRLMVEAGFKIVFVGIETPNEASLVECNKAANRGRDMVDMVKKIHNHGLEIYGGFVIGFDNDDSSIFDRQIEFIQNSGIVISQVSLLMALPGTKLYNRLKSENRLIEESHGDNTDFSLNYTPKMDSTLLISGYRRVLNTIYSPKQYYERMRTFYGQFNPPEDRSTHPPPPYYTSLFKLLWILGFMEKGRAHFWKLFIITILRYPRLLAMTMRRSVYRLHLSRITQRIINDSCA